VKYPGLAEYLVLGQELRLFLDLEEGHVGRRRGLFLRRDLRAGRFAGRLILSYRRRLLGLGRRAGGALFLESVLGDSSCWVVSCFVSGGLGWSCAAAGADHPGEDRAADRPDRGRHDLGADREGRVSAMFESGEDPAAIVEKKGLKQISEAAAIGRIADEIIATNQDQVAKLASNPRVFGWFVGQVMKATQGRANPGLVNEVLRNKLAG
jgi:hypothetical protein